MDSQTRARLLLSRDFIMEGFGERVTLADAARVACLSPFHYHRLFSREFGETPQEALTRRRIDYARRLLATTDLPVTEVCLEVGFASLGTFSAKFKAIVGLSPTEYRHGARRFYLMSGFRAHRFLPMCFMRPRLAVVRNGKIEEAVSAANPLQCL